jgi:hypothetical protein
MPVHCSLCQYTRFWFRNKQSSNFGSLKCNVKRHVFLEIRQMATASLNSNASFSIFIVDGAARLVLVYS